MAFGIFISMLCRELCTYFQHLTPPTTYDGSLYLEDMRQLSKSAPPVYKHFSEGNFSIKDKPGRFTAVGGDQKLEQSINLSTKCSDGVIGHCKQKEYVAQWDLLYHEMIAVKNLHREYTSVTEGNYESWTHHESSQCSTTRKKDHIQAMITFVEEKGSPLSSETPLVLHNFVPNQTMTPQIREDMLHALDKGEQKYLEYRSQRLIKKTAKVCEIIHRSNLKSMKTISNIQQKTPKKAVRTVNITEKAIAVARDRGMSTD